MELSFIVTGAVCKFNAYSFVAAGLHIFVIFLFVGAAADAMGPIFDPDFVLEKFDDEGEREKISSMLERMDDHGVPFSLEDLRLRLASGAFEPNMFERNRTGWLRALGAALSGEPFTRRRDGGEL